MVGTPHHPGSDPPPGEACIWIQPMPTPRGAEQTSEERQATKDMSPDATWAACLQKGRKRVLSRDEKTTMLIFKLLL